MACSPIRRATIRATELLGQIAEAGVTIELVDGDRPHLDRLGASLADYSTAGSLMAEQAANLVHASGTDTRVLLLAGDPYTDSHYLTARAFHNYLREHNVPWQVEDLTGAHAQVKQLEHELNQRLKSSEAPELICSVFAVGSELIADALVAANKAGEVMVIGNDLFPESALALRRGIFTNIVYKDPVSLAYRGAKTLGDYLLWGKTPAEPVQKGAVGDGVCQQRRSLLRARRNLMRLGSSLLVAYFLAGVSKNCFEGR